MGGTNKNWTPREGRCCVCGIAIWKSHNKTKYCPECAQIMGKVKGKERKEAAAARLRREKLGLKDKDHECRAKGSCAHGGADSCMYLSDTGRLRILDGYYIKDGKCDAYQPRKGARRKKVTFPETAPVLGVNKLREV